MTERKMGDSCAASIEFRCTLSQFGEYRICIDAFAAIEFFAALL